MKSTRDAILEAAARLFGEVGFDAASTRLIGERSGINKALIHYHFADKQDLWNHVVERYYERLSDALAPALETPGPIAERSAELITAHLDFLAANREFACMVQREIAGGRHARGITAIMAPLFRRGAALLHDALPATRGGPLAAEQLLVSFFGMAVSWVSYAPVVEGLLRARPLSARALARRKEHLVRMVALVVAALEAEPPPHARKRPARTPASRRRKGARS